MKNNKKEDVESAESGYLTNISKCELNKNLEPRLSAARTSISITSNAPSLDDLSDFAVREYEYNDLLDTSVSTATLSNISKLQLATNYIKPVIDDIISHATAYTPTEFKHILLNKHPICAISYSQYSRAFRASEILSEVNEDLHLNYIDNPYPIQRVVVNTVTAYPIEQLTENALEGADRIYIDRDLMKQLVDLHELVTDTMQKLKGTSPDNNSSLNDRSASSSDKKGSINKSAKRTLIHNVKDTNRRLFDEAGGFRRTPSGNINEDDDSIEIRKTDPSHSDHTSPNAHNNTEKTNPSSTMPNNHPYALTAHKITDRSSTIHTNRSCSTTSHKNRDHVTDPASTIHTNRSCTPTAHKNRDQMTDPSSKIHTNRSCTPSAHKNRDQMTDPSSKIHTNRSCTPTAHNNTDHMTDSELQHLKLMFNELTEVVDNLKAKNTNPNTCLTTDLKECSPCLKKAENSCTKTNKDDSVIRTQKDIMEYLKELNKMKDLLRQIDNPELIIDPQSDTHKPCCNLKDFPHVHAKLNGKPVIIKINQETIDVLKNDADDGPINKHHIQPMYEDPSVYMYEVKVDEGIKEKSIEKIPTIPATNKRESKRKSEPKKISKSDEKRESKRESRSSKRKSTLSNEPKREPEEANANEPKAESEEPNANEPIRESEEPNDEAKEASLVERQDTAILVTAEVPPEIEQQTNNSTIPVSKERKSSISNKRNSSKRSSKSTPKPVKVTPEVPNKIENDAELCCNTDLCATEIMKNITEQLQSCKADVNTTNPIKVTCRVNSKEDEKGKPSTNKDLICKSIECNTGSAVIKSTLICRNIQCNTDVEVVDSKPGCSQFIENHCRDFSCVTDVADINKSKAWATDCSNDRSSYYCSAYETVTQDKLCNTSKFSAAPGCSKFIENNCRSIQCNINDAQQTGICKSIDCKIESSKSFETKYGCSQFKENNCQGEECNFLDKKKRSHNNVSERLKPGCSKSKENMCKGVECEDVRHIQTSTFSYKAEEMPGCAQFAANQCRGADCNTLVKPGCSKSKENMCKGVECEDVRHIQTSTFSCKAEEMPGCAQFAANQCTGAECNTVVKPGCSKSKENMCKGVECEDVRHIQTSTFSCKAEEMPGCAQFAANQCTGAECNTVVKPGCSKSKENMCKGVECEDVRHIQTSTFSCKAEEMPGCAQFAANQCTGAECITVVKPGCSKSKENMCKGVECEDVRHIQTSTFSCKAEKMPGCAQFAANECRGAECITVVKPGCSKSKENMCKGVECEDVRHIQTSTFSCKAEEMPGCAQFAANQCTGAECITVVKPGCSKSKENMCKGVECEDVRHIQTSTFSCKVEEMPGCAQFAANQCTGAECITVVKPGCSKSKENMCKGVECEDVRHIQTSTFSYKAEEMPGCAQFAANQCRGAECNTVVKPGCSKSKENMCKGVECEDVRHIQTSTFSCKAEEMPGCAQFAANQCTGAECNTVVKPGCSKSKENMCKGVECEDVRHIQTSTFSYKAEEMPGCAQFASNQCTGAECITVVKPGCSKSKENMCKGVECKDVKHIQTSTSYKALAKPGCAQFPANQCAGTECNIVLKPGCSKSKENMCKSVECEDIKHAKTSTISYKTEKMAFVKPGCSQFAANQCTGKECKNASAQVKPGCSKHKANLCKSTQCIFNTPTVTKECLLQCINYNISRPVSTVVNHMKPKCNQFKENACKSIQCTRDREERNAKSNVFTKKDCATKMSNITRSERNVQSERQVTMIRERTCQSTTCVQTRDALMTNVQQMANLTKEIATNYIRSQNHGVAIGRCEINECGTAMSNKEETKPECLKCENTDCATATSNKGGIKSKTTIKSSNCPYDICGPPRTHKAELKTAGKAKSGFIKCETKECATVTSNKGEIMAGKAKSGFKRYDFKECATATSNKEELMTRKTKSGFIKCENKECATSMSNKGGIMVGKNKSGFIKCENIECATAMSNKVEIMTCKVKSDFIKCENKECATAMSNKGEIMTCKEKSDFIKCENRECATPTSHFIKCENKECATAMSNKVEIMTCKPIPDFIKCENKECATAMSNKGEMTTCKLKSDFIKCENKECATPMSDFIKCENKECATAMSNKVEIMTCKPIPDFIKCENKECATAMSNKVEIMTCKPIPDFIKCENKECATVMSNKAETMSCKPMPDFIKCENRECTTPMYNKAGTMTCQEISDFIKCENKECATAMSNKVEVMTCKAMPVFIKCENKECATAMSNKGGMMTCKAKSDFIKCENRECATPMFNKTGTMTCLEKSDFIKCENKECATAMSNKAETCKPMPDFIICENKECATSMSNKAGTMTCQEKSDFIKCENKECATAMSNKAEIMTCKTKSDFIKCENKECATAMSKKTCNKSISKHEKDFIKCENKECATPMPNKREIMTCKVKSDFIKCENRECATPMSNKAGTMTCQEISDFIKCENKECATAMSNKVEIMTCKSKPDFIKCENKECATAMSNKVEIMTCKVKSDFIKCENRECATPISNKAGTMTCQEISDFIKCENKECATAMSNKVEIMTCKSKPDFIKCENRECATPMSNKAGTMTCKEIADFIKCKNKECATPISNKVEIMTCQEISDFIKCENKECATAMSNKAEMMTCKSKPDFIKCENKECATAMSKKTCNKTISKHEKDFIKCENKECATAMSKKTCDKMISKVGNDFIVKECAKCISDKEITDDAQCCKSIKIETIAYINCANKGCSTAICPDINIQEPICNVTTSVMSKTNNTSNKSIQYKNCCNKDCSTKMSNQSKVGGCLPSHLNSKHDGCNAAKYAIAKINDYIKCQNKICSYVYQTTQQECDQNSIQSAQFENRGCNAVMSNIQENEKILLANENSALEKCKVTTYTSSSCVTKTICKTQLKSNISCSPVGTHNRGICTINSDITKENILHSTTNKNDNIKCQNKGCSTANIISKSSCKAGNTDTMKTLAASSGTNNKFHTKECSTEICDITKEIILQPTCDSTITVTVKYHNKLSGNEFGDLNNNENSSPANTNMKSIEGNYIEPSIDNKVIQNGDKNPECTLTKEGGEGVNMAGEDACYVSNCFNKNCKKSKKTISSLTFNTSETNLDLTQISMMPLNTEESMKCTNATCLRRQVMQVEDPNKFSYNNTIDNVIEDGIQVGAGEEENPNKISYNNQKGNMEGAKQVSAEGVENQNKLSHHTNEDVLEDIMQVAPAESPVFATKTSTFAENVQSNDKISPKIRTSFKSITEKKPSVMIKDELSEGDMIDDVMKQTTAAQPVFAPKIKASSFDEVNNQIDNNIAVQQVQQKAIPPQIRPSLKSVSNKKSNVIIKDEISCFEATKKDNKDCNLCKCNKTKLQGANNSPEHSTVTPPNYNDKFKTKENVYSAAVTVDPNLYGKPTVQLYSTVTKPASLTKKEDIESEKSFTAFIDISASKEYLLDECCMCSKIKEKKINKSKKHETGYESIEKEDLTDEFLINGKPSVVLYIKKDMSVLNPECSKCCKKIDSRDQKIIKNNFEIIDDPKKVDQTDSDLELRENKNVIREAKSEKEKNVKKKGSNNAKEKLSKNKNVLNTSEMAVNPSQAKCDCTVKKVSKPCKEYDHKSHYVADGVMAGKPNVLLYTTLDSNIIVQNAELGPRKPCQCGPQSAPQNIEQKVKPDRKSVNNRTKSRKSLKETASKKSLKPTASRKSMKQTASRKSLKQTASRKSVKPTASRKSMKQTASRKSLKQTASRKSVKPTASRKSMKQTASRKDLKQTASRKSIKPTASRKSMKQTASRKDLKQTASRKSVKPTASRKSMKQTASRKDLKQTASRKSIKPNDQLNTTKSCQCDSKTFAKSLKGTASRKSLKGAASKKSLKGKASRKSLKNTASRKSMKGTASKKSIKCTPSKKSVKGNASRKSLKGNASRKSMKGTASRKSLKGTASRKSMKPTASRKSMKGTASRKSLKGAASKKSMKGTASRKSLKGAASKKSMKGTASRKSMKGTASKKSIKASASKKGNVLEVDIKPRVSDENKNTSQIDIVMSSINAKISTSTYDSEVEIPFDPTKSNKDLKPSGSNKSLAADQENLPPTTLNQTASRKSLHGASSRKSIKASPSKKAASRKSLKQNASRKSLKGNASRKSIKGNASRKSLKGNASRKSLKGNASRKSLKGNASRKSIKGNASRKSLKGNASRKSLKAAGSRKSIKKNQNITPKLDRKNCGCRERWKAKQLALQAGGMASKEPLTKKELKQNASRKSIKGSASKKSVKGNASRKSLKGNASRKSLKGNASRKSLKGNASRKSLKGTASRKSLKGTASKKSIKESSSRKSIKKTASRKSVKGSASKKSIKQSASRKSVKETASRKSLKGNSSRKSLKNKETEGLAAKKSHAKRNQMKQVQSILRMPGLKGVPSRMHNFEFKETVSVREIERKPRPSEEENKAAAQAVTTQFCSSNAGNPIYKSDKYIDMDVSDDYLHSLDIQDSEPSLPYTVTRTSLPNINICPPMKVGVETLKIYMQSETINHPRLSIKQKLKSIGIDNLLRASKPAKCCRKAVINEKSDEAAPFHASLNSLPLTDSDLKVIVKAATFEKRCMNNYYTQIYQSKFEYYTNFQENFASNFDYFIPKKQVFEVRFFEFLKREELEHDKQPKKPEHSFPSDNKHNSNKHGDTKPSGWHLFSDFKLSDIMRKFIHSSEDTSNSIKPKSPKCVHNKKCQTENRKKSHNNNIHIYRPSTKSLPLTIKHDHTLKKTSKVMCNDNIPERDVVYIKYDQPAINTRPCPTCHLDGLCDNSSLSPKNFAETLSAVYELDQNGNIRPKQDSIRQPTIEQTTTYEIRNTPKSSTCNSNLNTFCCNPGNLGTIYENEEKATIKGKDLIEKSEVTKTETFYDYIKSPEISSSFQQFMGTKDAKCIFEKSGINIKDFMDIFLQMKKATGKQSSSMYVSNKIPPSISEEAHKTQYRIKRQHSKIPKRVSSKILNTCSGSESSDFSQSSGSAYTKPNPPSSVPVPLKPMHQSTSFQQKNGSNCLAYRKKSVASFGLTNEDSILGLASNSSQPNVEAGMYPESVLCNLIYEDYNEPTLYNLNAVREKCKSNRRKANARKPFNGGEIYPVSSSSQEFMNTLKRTLSTENINNESITRQSGMSARSTNVSEKTSLKSLRKIAEENGPGYISVLHPICGCPEVSIFIPCYCDDRNCTHATKRQLSSQLIEQLCSESNEHHFILPMACRMEGTKPINTIVEGFTYSKSARTFKHSQGIHRHPSTRIHNISKEKSNANSKH